MIVKVFSVYDTSSATYSPPFFQPTIGSAIRSFGDAVSGPESNLTRHPSDFILFELASYDDNTGKFISLDQPNKLAVATEFVKVASNAV